MTSLLLHNNPDIFPNPDKFDPERWMDLTERHRLEKYLVAFSKGSRQCIGIPYVIPFHPPFIISMLEKYSRAVH